MIPDLFRCARQLSRARIKARSAMAATRPHFFLKSHGQTVIFDAGTGIIQAGRYLSQRLEGGGKIHLFLTHLHIDHIQGLPFFKPLYNPRMEVIIHCPETLGRQFSASH